MELLKIIWQKKYFVFTIVFFSMGTTIFLNKIKPAIYKTEAMVLIFSPYNPNNSNLPSAPYSKFFNDFFHGLNFKSIVLENIKKKYPQANIAQNDFDKMASIEFIDKSNWAKIQVNNSSPQISIDLANIIAESFVSQINETLNMELAEIDKIFGKELNNFEKKLSEIENELKKLQLPNNTQLVSDYNNSSSQFNSYKNQMRDLEIYFDGIQKRIKELERQLKEAEGSSEPNQAIINSLKSQLNSHKPEEAVKSSEIKIRAEYIVKLEKELEGLNKKIVKYNTEMANYNIESKRLEMERSLIETQLRSMAAKADQAKLDAKSKQISAKILEFPKEAELLKNDLKRDLVWAGAGSLIFSIFFLWLFFL